MMLVTQNTVDAQQQVNNENRKNELIQKVDSKLNELDLLFRELGQFGLTRCNDERNYSIRHIDLLKQAHGFYKQCATHVKDVTLIAQTNTKTKCNYRQTSIKPDINGLYEGGKTISAFGKDITVLVKKQNSFDTRFISTGRGEIYGNRGNIKFDDGKNWSFEFQPFTQTIFWNGINGGNKWVKTEWDETCKWCPRYQIADKDKTQCIMDQCKVNEIRLADGKCQKCPLYSRVWHDGTSCGTDTCKDYQIVDEDGYCVICPAYHRPMDELKFLEHEQQITQVTKNRKRCGQDQCTRRQILKVNGKCETCETFLVPDIDSRKCVKSHCDFEYQIVNEHGICGKCPPYQRPTQDGRSCTQESCSGRQILLGNGKCRQCPDYMTPNSSCEHYTQQNACITGYNLQSYQNRNYAECKQQCEQTPDCVAFEMFKDHTNTGPRGNIQPGFCQTKSLVKKENLTDTRKYWSWRGREYWTWKNEKIREELFKGCDYITRQLQIYIREDDKNCPDFHDDEGQRHCIKPVCEFGRENSCDGTCVSAICRNGQIRSCTQQCISPGFQARVGAEALIKKTYYREDKGHCVRENDGGSESNLQRVQVISKDQSCQLVCNNEENCVAYEEYKQFNQCQIWRRDSFSNYVGTGFGTKSCFVKQFRDFTDKQLAIKENYLVQQGKCKRVLYDKHHIHQDNYLPIKFTRVYSKNQCQNLCNIDPLCSAFYLKQDEPTECYTARKYEISFYHGDENKDWRCYLKSQNNHDLNRTYWSYYMHNYRRDRGHCVRVSDGKWNKSNYVVHTLRKLRTCEQLCNYYEKVDENLLKETCVAYEEYHEYNQCLIWKRDVTSAYRGNEVGNKHCYVKLPRDRTQPDTQYDHHYPIEIKDRDHGEREKVLIEEDSLKMITINLDQELDKRNKVRTGVYQGTVFDEKSVSVFTEITDSVVVKHDITLGRSAHEHVEGQKDHQLTHEEFVGKWRHRFSGALGRRIKLVLDRPVGFRASGGFNDFDYQWYLSENSCNKWIGDLNKVSEDNQRPGFGSTFWIFITPEKYRPDCSLRYEFYNPQEKDRNGVRIASRFIRDVNIEIFSIDINLDKDLNTYDSNEKIVSKRQTRDGDMPLLKLTRGERYRLILNENRSTGFTWAITFNNCDRSVQSPDNKGGSAGQDKNWLTWESDYFVQANSGLRGAGGVHYWTFITPEKYQDHSDCEIWFEYRSSGVNNNALPQTKKVYIEVLDDQFTDPDGYNEINDDTKNRYKYPN